MFKRKDIRECYDCAVGAGLQSGPTTIANAQAGHLTHKPGPWQSCQRDFFKPFQRLIKSRNNINHQLPITDPVPIQGYEQGNEACF